MVSVKIKINKKDLWIVSALAVFFVGFGLIIAYDWNTGAGTGLPSVQGHTSNEIEGVVAGGGGGLGFGDWVDLSGDVAGEKISDVAATDGILVATCDGNGGIEGYTNNILRIRTEGTGHSPNRAITMPVKKGDSWKIVFISSATDTVHWIPISGLGGAGGAGGVGGSMDWSSACTSQTQSGKGALICAADEYLIDTFVNDYGDSASFSVNYGLGGSLISDDDPKSTSGILCCKNGAGGGSSYVSDWKAISIDGSVTFDHGLGTDELSTTLQFKPTLTGPISVAHTSDYAGSGYGVGIYEISSTQVKVSGGSADLRYWVSDGTTGSVTPSSGYVRVLASAA
ncbi:hypothetical protein GOV14_00355 [Candidatus Pacearchaeota archaeon]|nr:hypothetical protein [Candidatus Pacearchaeota archaeon]